MLPIYLSGSSHEDGKYSMTNAGKQNVGKLPATWLGIQARSTVSQKKIYIYNYNCIFINIICLLFNHLFIFALNTAFIEGPSLAVNNVTWTLEVWNYLPIQVFVCDFQLEVISIFFFFFAEIRIFSVELRLTKTMLQFRFFHHVYSGCFQSINLRIHHWKLKWSYATIIIWTLWCDMGNIHCQPALFLMNSMTSYISDFAMHTFDMSRMFFFFFFLID